MDIHEFTALVGETPRQIRFLVAEGFMPSPTGGRAHAQYGPEHVEAVRRYRWLRTSHSPAQIKLMMSAGSDTVRLPVAPGIELHLDLALLGPSLNPQKVAERVRELLTDLPAPDGSNDTPMSRGPDQPREKDPADVA